MTRTCDGMEKVYWKSVYTILTQIKVSDFC